MTAVHPVMAKRRASSDMTRAMRDAADVSAVLAYRLPLLWLEAMAPNPARRRERTRMIGEKSEAAAAGAFEASMALWRAGMNAWVAPFSPVATMEAMTRAAYAPTRTALRRNARRLKARKTI